MKKVDLPFQTSEQFNLSDEEFEQKQVDDFNAKKGLLEDGFNCDNCKNKGRVRQLVDGYPIQTECPKCMPKRRSIRIAKKSGMGDLLNHKVANFKTTQPFQEQMKELAIKYVKSDSRDWLTLLGQSGCGKTMLCSAVANTLINKQCETLYISWTNLLNELRNNLDKSIDLLSKYQKIQVLYIDDLFKGQIKDYAKEIAYELINYRYNNKLTTIVSSELNMDELSKIDQATAGRIREMAGEYLLCISDEVSKNYRFK